MSDTLCLHLAHDSTELLKQSVARTAGEKGEEGKKINLGSIRQCEEEKPSDAGFHFLQAARTWHALTSAGSALCLFR